MTKRTLGSTQNQIRAGMTFLLAACVTPVFAVNPALFVTPATSLIATTQATRSAMTGANGNRADVVRSDLEAYINALPDTAAQKQALRQTARAFAAVLAANLSDGAALANASNMLSAASSCIYGRYPDALAGKRAKEMEARSVNTRERAATYHRYSIAMNGTTSLSPAGDGCTE